MMGKHERAALELEYIRLAGQPLKSQADGRRLDEMERLLDGKLPYPYGKGSEFSGNSK